jgi:hypothetical protein
VGNQTESWASQYFPPFSFFILGVRALAVSYTEQRIPELCHKQEGNVSTLLVFPELKLLSINK